MASGVDAGGSEEGPARRPRFSSELALSYRDALERLFFFNPGQERVATALVATVQRYGVPVIVEDGARLRFSVPAFPAVQTLFALDDSGAPPRLTGVAIYGRETAETMLLMHLAIDEEYAAGGDKADAWVGPRLLSAIRAICLQTRGVTGLRLLYPREALLTVRATSAP